jgi:hypothetical protein
MLIGGGTMVKHSKWLAVAVWSLIGFTGCAGSMKLAPNDADVGRDVEVG